LKSRQAHGTESSTSSQQANGIANMWRHLSFSHVIRPYLTLYH
jgi:hypothetical protein